MLDHFQKRRLMEYYGVSWLEITKLTKADISQARATWIAESESQDAD